MKTITTEEAERLIKEAEKLSRDELKELQNKRLKELVGFVRENSPLFRELYRDIPEDFTITDLPAVRRDELVPRYEDWVTERGIRREEVLKFMEEQEGWEKYLGKYSILHTSGTTSEPMPMLRDDYHNVIHLALMRMRLYGGSMPEVLDLSRYKKLGVIYAHKGVSSYNSYLRQIEAHPEYRDNFVIVSTIEPTEKILKTAQELRPDSLSGYPSALAVLAEAQLQGRISLDIKLVLSSAELMTEGMYATIKKAFNCPVLNNYCSTEGGEAAMASDCPHLHINEDWIIIEPVDKEGNVIKPDTDQWSEGIYITDLTNQIQPIIRYYMSDRVKIHTTDDGYGKPFYWMEVQDRTGSLFTFCGKQLMIIQLASCVAENVLLIQFIQNAPDEMEIRLIPEPGYDKQKLLEETKSIFTSFMEGEGCKGFKVTASDKDLIKNERGGKLSYYYKNY
ncbi:MAG: phenylacetate--CoA ligase family protein [Lachnospiraceae bacterium]|nr:phenylacetate--CoA ligase family protein [Lachnospiraceae bacterium]